MAWDAAKPAGNQKIRLSDEEIRANWIALETALGADLTLVGVGTKMVFYADTAPTGWTIDNTLNDKLLFVTKGSVAGGETGGGAHATGTWTQPNHTHTGPSHTHTGPSHTHTGPSHTHQLPLSCDATGIYAADAYKAGGGVAHNIAAGASAPGPWNMPSLFSYADGTGATSADGTGATGADGTGATGGGATVNTYRPACYCVIICSKD